MRLHISRVKPLNPLSRTSSLINISESTLRKVSQSVTLLVLKTLDINCELGGGASLMLRLSAFPIRPAPLEDYYNFKIKGKKKKKLQ